MCGRSLVYVPKVPPLIKTGSEASCLPGSSCYPLLSPFIRSVPPDSSRLQHHESFGCRRLRRRSAPQTKVPNFCACINKKQNYLPTRSSCLATELCTAKVCTCRNVFQPLTTFKMLSHYRAVLPNRI